MNDRQRNPVPLIVAALLIGAGLLLALLPSESRGVDCGSVLAPHETVADGAGLGDIMQEITTNRDCAQTRRVRALIAGVVGLLGLAILISSLRATTGAERQAGEE